MKKTICIALVFATLLSLSLIPFPTSALKLKPGVQNLREDFYADPPSAWAAFKAGLADMYGFGLTPDQIADARTDFDIMLAPYEESGMFEFDLNNNYTIAAQPGRRSPTSYTGFRQALAHLTDKDYIIDVILEGFAGRMDVPLPVPLSGYFDPAGIDPGKFPYVFSLDAARAKLNAAGFTESTETNPDGDNWRLHPDGSLMDPIIIYARSDSPPRYDAALLLRDNMISVGIPVDFRPYTFAGVYGPVFTDKNYHIYTGGWGLGRFPTFLWFLYHSDWWKVGVPWPNYVTGKDQAGIPVHPELDGYLDGIWFATDVEGMRASVQEAMEYMFNQSVTIPLWSWKGFMAYRKSLLGVVNMQMFGIENSYTWLNVKKTGAKAETLILALVTPPVKINPYYGSDFYGWQVASYLYSGLMSVAPYNVARDQPWVAQDWLLGTWVDPDDGLTKSKITYWLRKDNYFSDGVQFTAEDYKFSMTNLYAYDDSWLWDSSMDIHHIDIINDFQVEVYMQELSVWMLYAPTFPLVPKHVWLQDVPGWPLATKVTETVPVGPGGVVQLTGEPVHVESVVGLSAGDYNLFLSPNPEAVLKILTPSPPSTATVTYWEAGYARGYTPADLPGTEILIGNGIFQLDDLSPGAGGFAFLKRNPYRDEAIPKGEIDYWWTWVLGPKPRSGYYEVNVFDVALLYKGLYTRGDGDPDGSLPPDNWITAADIAVKDESRGVIDEYDISVMVPHSRPPSRFGIPP